MCGIYLSSSPSSEYNLSINIEKFNSLKHRGVDNSSYLEISSTNKIFLGHHRLSINDLSSRANQPFYTDCKKYYVLFNGEIFNFKKLRKTIKYDFKTQTDTEVIIAGYKIFGRNFLKQLEGFFSIVILDIPKNILVATVDPTSAKSLYYEKKNRTISLSSELTSFIPKSNLLDNLNHQALEIYLQYGYIHAPNSIIKNTFKFEPGELIEFDLNSCDKNNFKNFNKHFKKNNHRPLEELIIEAHKSRLLSDVPIATMLSSGVDSTLTNLIYSKLNKKKENVFTLGICNSRLDESKIAVKQIKSKNLDHKILYVSQKDILNEFKKVSIYLDEPFADSSCILVSLLSKEISKKYKVVISSDGGDELLYGYSRHRFFFSFFWICHLPKTLKNIIKKILTNSWFQGLLGVFKIPHLEIKINKICGFLDQNEKTKAYINLIKLIPDSITSQIMKNYNGDKLIDQFQESQSFKTIKEIDYNFYLPSINFKNDRCGMQHSLEIREPLLNFELVRSQFDRKMKAIDVIISKKTFRNFLKKNHINVSKKKYGFSFSQKEILEFDDFKILNEFEKDLNYLKDLFNTSFIKTMIMDFKSCRKWTTELWILISLSFWLKNKI